MESKEVKIKEGSKVLDRRVERLDAMNSDVKNQLPRKIYIFYCLKNDCYVYVYLICKYLYFIKTCILKIGEYLNTKNDRLN